MIKCWWTRLAVGGTFTTLSVISASHAFPSSCIQLDILTKNVLIEMKARLQTLAKDANMMDTMK